MARLVIDGTAHELRAGTDLAALRRRAHDVMTGRAGNAGLDTVPLADSSVLEVNWRTVRTVRIEGGG